VAFYTGSSKQVVVSNNAVYFYQPITGPGYLLSNAADFAVSAYTNGAVMAWDSTAGKWAPAAQAAAAGTNGLASIIYVDTATNAIGWVTNGLASTAYVGAAVTNVSTNGLASILYVAAAVTNVSTNGLASTIYVANAVTNISTNGLASIIYLTNYTDTAGFTNRTVTNNLASTNFVDTGYVRTNETRNVTIAGGTQFSNMWFSGGNVGVGTSSPSYSLEMVKDGQSVIALNSYGASGNTIFGQMARNTRAAPSNSMANDNILFLGARGYGDTGFSSLSRVALLMSTAENWTDSAQGTYMRFETTKKGTTSRGEKMRIDDDGNVGIGTNNPLASLHVSGAYGGSDNAVIAKFEDLNTANGVGPISLRVGTDNHFAGNPGVVLMSSSNALYLGVSAVADLSNNRIFGVNGGGCAVFVGRSSATALRGGLYFDSDDNTFYKCTNGTTWTAIGTAP
jgi:hypothetical protein